MEETVETSDSIELTQEEKDALAVQMNHIETAKQEKLRKAKDSMIKKKISIIKSILLLVDTQIDYHSKQQNDSEEEIKKHTDAMTSLRGIISRHFDELIVILDGEDHPMVDTIKASLTSIDEIIKQFEPEPKKDYIVVLKDNYVKLEDYNQLATLVLEMKEELDNTKSRLSYLNQKITNMDNRTSKLYDSGYGYFKKRHEVDLSRTIDQSLMESTRRYQAEKSIDDMNGARWVHLDRIGSVREFSSEETRLGYNEIFNPNANETPVPPVVPPAPPILYVDSNQERPSEIESQVTQDSYAPPF